MFRLPVPQNASAQHAPRRHALNITLANSVVDQGVVDMLVEYARQPDMLCCYTWRSSFLATDESAVYAHSSVYFDQLMLAWAVAIEFFFMKRYRDAAGMLFYAQQQLLPLVSAIGAQWPLAPMLRGPPEVYEKHYAPIVKYFALLALDDEREPMRKGMLYMEVIRTWRMHTLSAAAPLAELARYLTAAFKLRFKAIVDEENIAGIEAQRLATLMAEMDVFIQNGEKDSVDDDFRTLAHEVNTRLALKRFVSKSTESVPISAVAAAAADVPSRMVVAAAGFTHIASLPFFAQAFYTRYTPAACALLAAKEPQRE